MSVDAGTGEIYVDVLPRASDFWQRFVGQARPGATKAGDELGAAVGKGIQSRIADGLRDGIAEGTRGAAAQGARFGEEVGKAARQRIDAALRNIGVSVDLDAAGLSRTLTRVEQTLNRLDGRKITVTVEADITRGLIALQAVADAVRYLDGRTANVGVDADTGAASADLTALAAQARALGSLNPTINVNTASATSNIQLLLNAGFAIAPAFVPAAAAAAGAILGIGAAAGAAAAAVGVGALAFSGIGDAVKALDKAQQDAGKSAATAAAAAVKLRDSMNGLSPAGRDFAEFIFGLKGNLDQLRAAAAGGLLPGAQTAIQTLLPYFGDLRDLVGDVSDELGSLARDGAAALTNPFWRGFFGYIGSTAVPNMRILYQSSLNVATGFAGIIQAADPLQRTVGQGILDLTGRFAEFGATLRNNTDFQQFVEYAITRGPGVVETIGDLVGVGLQLATAYAPIGDAIVPAIQALANVIGAIPVPVLTALLATFTAYKVVALGAGLAQGILNSSLVTGGQRMLGFGTATTTATTQVAGFRAGSAGLAAFMGGPFGIGLAAATLAVGLFLSSNAQAKAKIDALQQSAGQYAAALKGGMTPAAIEQARAALQQDAALRGLVRTTQDLGISTETLVRGLNGGKAERAEVVNAINKEIEAQRKLQSAYLPTSEQYRAANDRIAQLEGMRIAFAKQNTAMAESGDLTDALTRKQRESNAAGAEVAKTAGDVRKALSESGGTAESYKSTLDALGATSVDSAGKAGLLAIASQRVADSNLTGADRARLFGGVLDQLGDAAGTSGPVFDALAGTFNNIAATSLSAHDKVGLLNRAIDALYGAAISQVEADEALIRAQADLTVQVTNNSFGFDLNTAKKQGNTQAVLANRDALERALQAARDTYVQSVANGEREDIARGKHEATTKSILDAIPPTQRNTTAVKDLVDKYGAIPARKQTEVTTPGLDQAILDLIEAHAIQVGLTQKWDKGRIQAEIASLKSQMFGGYAGDPRAFKAEGGIIPGYSPTATADNIPAMLTAGEYVHPVASVQYYGTGVMEAIRTRQLPKDFLNSGGHRHYAGGGYVAPTGNWPITIDSNSVVRPVDKEDLWRQWERATQPVSASIGSPDFGAGPGFGAWPSSPGAQRGDSGVWRSIVALIRSTGPLSGSFGNGYRPGDPLWHGCVPMDTLILTRRGWITYSDVRVGEDETVGFNPATGCSEWTRIVGMHHYDDAELWTIEADGWSADVTPGHKWLTGDGLMETRDFTADTRVRVATPLASDVAGAGLVDEDRHVSGVRRTAVRAAEVFCPTTTLGTWTARQGDRVFLTGNSGRAVDWMGFQQDALADFLAAHRPLELIHRSNKRDYAYTRGVNKGSFNNQLMNEHKNHVHVAMAAGGLVPGGYSPTAAGLNVGTYDTGGILPPGLTLAYNGTGAGETVRTAPQEAALTGGERARGLVHIDTFVANDNDPHAIARELDWQMRSHG